MHIALPALATVFALSACTSASPQARQARTLLARGEYQAANRAADQGLAERPDDADLWRVKLRAQLAAGDAKGAVRAYQDWLTRRGSHDREALREMARTTLWQGLQAPAPALVAESVQIVERHAIEAFAHDVAELVTADSDQVAAAAAVAVISVHPHAPRVLVDILKSEDAQARAIATAGIGRRVGHHARADVVPMLEDSSPLVRRAAITAVAGFASSKDLDTFAAMAASDPDGAVRALALRTLARKGAGGRFDVAKAAVADDYKGARLAGIDLLVEIDSAEARALLAELVTGDSELALPAAAALLRAGDRSGALPQVLEAELAQPAWNRRAAAVNAVSGGPRELALRMAGRAIVDPRAEVRLAAARLLIQLGGDDRAQRELEQALASPDAMIRIDAATDLLRLGAGGEEVLTAMAQHKDGDIRRAAVMAHASARRITSGLAFALADPNPELRLAAADLLLTLN